MMINLKKDLSSDEKTLAVFCMLLSDEAFDAWTGHTEITKDTYEEIFRTAAKFQSAALTLKLIEKFGSFASQI